MMFYFILKMVYCVYSLESPHRGDSNENKQHTLMLKENLKCPYKASCSGAIINPHWLELPLTRTNFPCPKGVRATEVLLYTQFSIGLRLQLSGKERWYNV